MSQDNIEIVRRLIDAFERRDLEPSTELWSEDSEWRPAMAGAVEGHVYRGHNGVRSYFNDFFESFSDVRIEGLELRDLGSRVLALYTLNVRGKDSGVAMTQPGAILFELDGGKITRGRSYLSQGDALEAAGLSE